MRPRRTHASNGVFHLDGHSEDHDLWVEKGSDSSTCEPILVSVWEPTDEERQAIAAGANIELVVGGTVHPPVCMQTTTVTLGKRPTEPS